MGHFLSCSPLGCSLGAGYTVFRVVFKKALEFYPSHKRITFYNNRENSRWMSQFGMDDAFFFGESRLVIYARFLRNASDVNFTGLSGRARAAGSVYKK